MSLEARYAAGVGRNEKDNEGEAGRRDQASCEPVFPPWVTVAKSSATSL